MSTQPRVREITVAGFLYHLPYPMRPSAGLAFLFGGLAAWAAMITALFYIAGTVTDSVLLRLLIFFVPVLLVKFVVTPLVYRRSSQFERSDA